MYTARYIGSDQFRVTDDKTQEETIVGHVSQYANNCTFFCDCGKDIGNDTPGRRCKHVLAVKQWEEKVRKYFL